MSKMKVNTQLFLDTLFQIHPKTNLNIDSLPSISYLLSQAPLNAASWVQIATQYCGLKQEEAEQLFKLYYHLGVDFVVFLFAVLFKSTVSSRRQKILQEDSLLSQNQSFEGLLQAYLQQYVDTLLASINTQLTDKIDLYKIRYSSDIYLAKIQYIFTFPAPVLSELQKCENLSQAAALLSQNVTEVQQYPTFSNISKQCYKINAAHEAYIVINGCSYAIFYIFNAKRVQISNCKNCKFYIPACGFLSISSSRGGIVSANCSFLKVQRCDEIRVFTSQLSYFVQDCSGLRWAPSNMIYSAMHDLLREAKIEALYNTRQYPPRYNGPLGYGFLGELQINYEFLTHVIPFGAYENAKFEFTIAQPFLDSLHYKLAKIQQIQEKLKQLTGDDKQYFEAECKVQLGDWLKQNGMSGEIGAVCNCVEVEL